MAAGSVCHGASDLDFVWQGLAGAVVGWPSGGGELRRGNAGALRHSAMARHLDYCQGGKRAAGQVAFGRASMARCLLAEWPTSGTAGQGRSLYCLVWRTWRQTDKSYRASRPWPSQGNFPVVAQQPGEVWSPGGRLSTPWSGPAWPETVSWANSLARANPASSVLGAHCGQGRPWPATVSWA